MSEDVVSVDPDADLDRILDILAAEDPDINRVPVVRDGFVEGIITRQDVLQALRRERESKA
jgi:CBS domain-containing protein